MKILLYTPTVGRGGVHRVVETLFRQLVTQYPEHHFEVLGQKYDEIGREVHYPCKFTQIKPVSKLPLHPEQFDFLLQNANAFHDHLKQFSAKFDVIYCPSPWWTIHVDGWAIKKPFVTSIPDFAFDIMEMGSGLTRHFRNVIEKVKERADVVVMSSNYWKDHAVRKYNMSNIHIIGHSGDFVTSGFSASEEQGMRVRKKYGLPEKYVLAFHCYGHKDPITILKGQLWARERANTVPPLVIAGIETGAYKQGNPIQSGAEGHVNEVRGVIRDIGATIGKDLFILGEIPDEDIGGLFANAYCSVTASRSEGDLPGAVFEAIGTNVPVICSDFPVFSEKLGEESAFMFRVGNSKDYGNKLIEACSDRSLAMQKAKNASEKLSGRSVKDVATDYMEIFKQCIG